MKLPKVLKKVVTPLLAIALLFGFYGTTVHATVGLSENQKDDYYAQYVEIASDVSEQTGRTVGVLPKDEFKESDWVTPSEFKKVALEFAAITPVIKTGGFSIQSTGSATKKTTFSVSSITETLSITGSFETQYSSFHQRQLFAGVNSISSKLASSSNGTWSQIDYDYDILDGGRTYYVTVSGKYTRLGLYTNIYASVYFYCSSVGAIS